MPRTRKAASPLCYIYSSPAMIRSLVKLEVRFPPQMRCSGQSASEPIADIAWAAKSLNPTATKEIFEYGRG